MVKFKSLTPQLVFSDLRKAGKARIRPLASAAALLWLGLTIVPTAKADSFTNTGAMTAQRWQHTATLLPNGKVLVAGGPLVPGTAEMYDPATGTWMTTGSPDARFAHTATLLPNGKVLVAGGFAGVALSSAQLYDPATGTWTAAGSLNAARYDHTATLLPDGKVVVAGGNYNNTGGTLSSVEVYDPATGIWTTVSALTTVRHSHTATLLPTGKVLVAGGRDNNAGNNIYVSSGELYDPATGTWTTTSALSTGRAYHTATLLPDGRVLVAGGGNASIKFSSAEVFDPATGTWTPTGALGTARSVHEAALLPNGKVLVAGGTANGSSYFSSAEVFDPASGTWTATGALNFARGFYTATVLSNGKVLVAGGYNGYALSSAEVVRHFRLTPHRGPTTEPGWILGEVSFTLGQCHGRNSALQLSMGEE